MLKSLALLTLATVTYAAPMEDFVESMPDMNDGKPISGILNELADITGRLMPNVPLDIVDQEPEEETESQKGKMDSEDKQKLNKEQEKQSNYHK